MMNRDPDSNEKQDDLQAELVAYLDDELDDVRRHEIDELLAHVPAVRDNVAGLGRAWDALDNLPRSEVDESFTRSTVEMIAVKASSDVQQQREAAPVGRRRTWMIGLATVAVMTLLGFFTAAALWPRPNDRLLADLPVVEDLDVYARTHSFEFVQRLNETKLFAATPAESTDVGPLDDPSLGSAHIERMEPAQKSQLLKKWERFQRLDPAEQQRMRDLHAAMKNDPRAASLRRMMRHYSQWQAELTPSDRAQLAKLEVEPRVARIQELRSEDAKRFTPGDMPRFREWLKEFAAMNKADLLDSLSRDRRRYFEGRGGVNNHRLIWLAGGLVFKKQLRSLVQPSDVDRLRQKLSADGQKKLDDAAELDKQRELIAGWIVMTIRESREDRFRLSQEELTDFLEQLEPTEKDDLLRLPADEMLEQLRGMYFHHKRNNGQRRRPNGGGPDARPRTPDHKPD